MPLLLDSNIFIEAQNRYYAQDIVPGFWKWMDYIVGKNFGTVAPVRDELLVKDDALGDWMRARKDSDWILAVDDEATQLAFASIANELDKSAQYQRPAIEKFLSGADPWLIAKAVAIGGTIVTHEVATPDAKARVPLPNLCLSRKVACQNTFDTLRSLGAKTWIADRRQVPPTPMSRDVSAAARRLPWISRHWSALRSPRRVAADGLPPPAAPTPTPTAG